MWIMFDVTVYWFASSTPTIVRFFFFTSKGDLKWENAEKRFWDNFAYKQNNDNEKQRQHDGNYMK